MELWYVRVDDVPDEVLAQTRARLTAVEEKRCAAYVFEANRREFLVTRALARHVLAPLHAGDLVFDRTEHDKPELSPPTDLRFNLTNTKELVACAAIRGHAIGVDAEPLDRAPMILDLAATVFVPEEQAELAALPVEARRRRAVAMWTTKEAFMKMLGTGLALPPLEIVAADVARDHPTATFELEAHLVTLCLAKGAPPPADLVPRRAVLSAS